MGRKLATLAIILAASFTSRAETPVREESCADVLNLAYAYTHLCPFMPGAYFCLQPPPTTRCWDFENGTLASADFGDWNLSQAGGAFANQPTYGDNVVASRALPTQKSPLHPQSGSMQDDLNAIGGNYWQTPYPIGHQGDYWLGTFEDRHTPLPPDVWGRTQGEGKTGVITSPSFVVDRSYLTFLIGGGCDVDIVNLALQVYDRRINKKTGASEWVWLQAFGPNGLLLRATGKCSELMERQWFDTSTLLGKTVRIVLTDNSPTAHLNVDHILHTSAFPTDLNGANRPLWGFADTHAHLGNHLAFKSLGTAWDDGYLFHGTPGHITTDHNQLAVELAKCDGNGHGPTHGAANVIKQLETNSLGSSTNWPKDCQASCAYPDGHAVHFLGKTSYGHMSDGIAPGANNTPSDLNGWPFWYTRAHQQMHLTWVQRAYQGGQRLMVASAGNAEVLGMAMRSSHLGQYLSDYGAMRRFAKYMIEMAGQNSDWLEIAYSPEDARRIIGQNKLAIILGAEVDDLGDHCAGNFPLGAWDELEDHSQTQVASPGDPWELQRWNPPGNSCSTEAQWKQRVDDLYNAGFRALIPIHLADNDLGGAAVYGDLFNSMNRFMRGYFFQVDVVNPSLSRVRYTLSPYTQAAGWTTLGLTGSLFGTDLAVAYSPVPVNIATFYQPAAGYINLRPLTSRANALIHEMRAKGMILDLAHMGEKGRNAILGIGAGNGTTSPLIAGGCDLNDPNCQARAYPAIASHSGLQELGIKEGINEGGLTSDMIQRIRDIGGTVAVGTSSGDLTTTDEATALTQPSAVWNGIYTQHVFNTCAGSTRTFAQGYVYALRKMKGKGITLGTDMNGLEAQLNPRFGTQGCYARGNVGRSIHYSPNGMLLVDDQSRTPFNYRADILGSANGGTAGAQRLQEFNSGQGLNYAHYNGVPYGGRYQGLFDPPGYGPLLAIADFGNASQNWWSSPVGNSMNALRTDPPLTASTTGGRTFDYNYDGLAQYGMLPDLLQDSIAVGVTNEQLGPLFQGAESFVRMWQKATAILDAP